MVDRNDKRFFDFMCSCGQENLARCDKVYEDVKASFRYRQGEDRDRLFTTLAVFELQDMDNGTAEIVGIPSDQWSAVDVEYRPYGDFDNPQKFWVECDRIHHGLARVYQLVKAFDESQGEERSGA